MAKPDRWNQGVAAALLAAIVVGGIGVKAVSGDEPSAVRGEPRTRIVGVVVDEAGRPVAGAGVNVTWFRKAPEDARTAVDGSFTLWLRGPTRSLEIVRATADGGARLGLAEYQESFTTEPLPVQVVLKPARTMTARVIDAGGAPVEAAAVEVVSMAHGPLAQGRTDARGIAEFRLPADADVAQVLALKPGLGCDYFENYRSWPPPRKPDSYPEEVVLTLDGARRLEIEAVDSAGRPAAGVEFHPWVIHKRGKRAGANLSGSDIALATTDADGIARFPWIPKRIEEVVTFSCRPWDFALVGISQIAPSEADARSTVRVLRNTRVAGRVFLTDGAPAAGVLVHAWGMTGSGDLGSGLTRTADDGSYSMRLAPDRIYMIALLDPRGAAPPLDGIILREGVPREGLDLRMIEGAIVRGRVTRGPDRRPVARERLRVEMTGDKVPDEFARRKGSRNRQRLDIELWAITDDEGRYSIRLAPGTFVIATRGPGERAQIRIDGNEEIVRDLEVAEPMAGVVVERNAGKRPVANAEVREVVTRNTGFAPGEAITDAQGRFEILAGKRPQLLYARSQDGALAGYADISKETGDVEVSVSAAATVLGRVVDGAGRPVASRRINFWIVGGAGAFEHEQLDWHLRTDEAGGFLFSGLVPGSLGLIGVPQSNDFRDERRPGSSEFKVGGPEPIVLPDITVSGDPRVEGRDGSR